MFGRTPRLPIDLVFGIKKGNQAKSYPSYVESLKDRLQKAYQTVSQNVEKAQKHQKSQYDRKVRGAVLSEVIEF